MNVKVLWSPSSFEAVYIRYVRIRRYVHCHGHGCPSAERSAPRCRVPATSFRSLSEMSDLLSRLARRHPYNRPGRLKGPLYHFPPVAFTASLSVTVKVSSASSTLSSVSYRHTDLPVLSFARRKGHTSQPSPPRNLFLTSLCCHHQMSPTSTCHLHRPLSVHSDAL